MRAHRNRYGGEGMNGFLRAALEFPAVLFGPALVVVIAYWLFVLVGAVGVDVLDGGGDIGTETAQTGPAGAFAAFGLGGVPVALALSLLLSIAWFLSLVCTALSGSTWLRLLALPLASAGAWSVTRLLVRPLRRLFREEEGITRRELVGRVCIVRTGRVGPDFGQAEVAAEDGSASVVQVRTDDAHEARSLTAGSSALIFDYDDAGEFFRVAPFGPTP